MLCNYNFNELSERFVATVHFEFISTEALLISLFIQIILICLNRKQYHNSSVDCRLQPQPIHFYCAFSSISAILSITFKSINENRFFSFPNDFRFDRSSFSYRNSFEHFQCIDFVELWFGKKKRKLPEKYPTATIGCHKDSMRTRWLCSI